MYKTLAPAMAALCFAFCAHAAKAEELTCSKAAPTLEELNRPKGNFELNPLENTRWLRKTTRGARRGVVMIIHGVAIRPSKMDSIGQVLTEAGYDVLRVALSGHRGSLDEMLGVTHEQWLREAFLSYCVAHEDAARDGAPLYAIGYSLGGALIENILNESSIETPAIARVALFAPAVALTLFTESGDLLNLFKGRLMVPTQIIGDYRANDWLTLQAYTGVIDTTHAVQRSGMRRSNVPTLVFGDIHDELVDTEGVERLAFANNLGAWSFERVKVAPGPFRPKFHHLIIDENAVGEDGWQVMADALLRHFEK